MSSITTAPANLIDIIARDGGLDDLARLTPEKKSSLFMKLGIVIQLDSAPRGAKGKIVATTARIHNVSKAAVNHWLGQYHSMGWRGLMDGRAAAAEGRTALPAVTKQWIKDKVLRCQRNDSVQEVHRQVLDQWRMWMRTGDMQWQIPGFSMPPKDAGKGFPAGFSYENFRKCQPTRYQAKLARQGRISAYRDLPSILSTRVGSAYLRTVFFDDQYYDVMVRVPGYERPMRPLGFNALDRLTAYHFQPHIRLRWWDDEGKKNSHLTQKEFVWYVIWFLCTEGFRTDEEGTVLIEEHGTAKTWSNKELSTPDGFHSFLDAVCALTEGKVRIESSALFNTAVFSELLYGPQSSGNPRFKAPIEASFRLVRTYSQSMIGQVGRNADEAPEENHGIEQYERQILKAMIGLPDSITAGMQSNFLTGVEFGQLSHAVYEAIRNRTEHNLEGWRELNFVNPVWRWEHEPEDSWRPRNEMLTLPSHVLDHAVEQQKRNPKLTDLINWSPAEARENLRQDPFIKRLKFSDAIHLLPTSWAKPVTVRSNHEIRITEELLPGEELVYLPEITTPSGRTEYLRPGDKVMVYLNPMMPDMLLVCDQQYRFIGTLVRSVRVGHDNAQLEAMLGARARLKSLVDAPVRRAKQPEANRREAVRDLNADLIAQAKEAGLVTKPRNTVREDKSAAALGRAVRASRSKPAPAPQPPSGTVEDWT